MGSVSVLSWEWKNAKKLQEHAATFLLLLASHGVSCRCLKHFLDSILAACTALDVCRCLIVSSERRTSQTDLDLLGACLSIVKGNWLLSVLLQLSNDSRVRSEILLACDENERDVGAEVLDLRNPL